MIYKDVDSRRRELKFPQCISGIFANQDQFEAKDLRHYDGKWVTLTGKRFKYSELPDEDRPVLRRKVLSGSIIINYCYGSNVLLIQKMRTLPNPDRKGN